MLVTMKGFHVLVLIKRLSYVCVDHMLVFNEGFHALVLRKRV